MIREYTVNLHGWLWIVYSLESLMSSWRYSRRRRKTCQPTVESKIGWPSFILLYRLYSPDLTCLIHNDPPTNPSLWIINSGLIHWLGGGSWINWLWEVRTLRTVNSLSSQGLFLDSSFHSNFEIRMKNPESIVLGVRDAWTGTKNQWSKGKVW